MKQFTLISLCLFQCFIYAQPEDKQWLITDDGYINGSSWEPIYSSFSSVDIYNVAYPDRRVEDDDGNIEVARNHFFVIYENGMHYNSRYSNNSITYQNLIDYTNYLSPTEVGYNILQSSAAQSDIQYLYLSNIYEEDDIDAIVVDGNPIQSNPALQNYQIDDTTPPAVITANHDVVKKKDITLIFDLDSLQRKQCDSTSYRLCFNIKSYNLKPKSTFTYNDIGLSPVFDGQSTIGMELGSMNDNCLSINHFEFSKPYAYLNLKMPLSIGEYKGEKMTFTLRSNDGSCVESWSEQIRDSHDPNFIEVMCVSRKCGYNIVKYHVECENEAATPVSNLSMSLILPYDFTDLTPTAAVIDGINTLTDLSPPNINTSTNLVEFDFNRGLRGGKTAYVEFCVRYLSLPEGIESANLQPSIPRTSFDDTMYAIENFIDIAQDTILKDPGEEGTVIYTTVSERPITKLCDCNYTYPTPCKELMPVLHEPIKAPVTPQKRKD